MLEVAPSAGGVNVSVNTNISVQFDDNIEMTTVSDSTFSVNGGAVSGFFSYNDQTKTVTFDPASELDYNTAYTVTLTKGITNPVGETLVSDYSWSFTTTALAQPNIEVYSPLGLLNSGGTWDYGSVLTGESKPAAFTINNSGSDILKISNMAITGADALLFVIDPALVFPLEVDTNFSVGVTANFSPGDVGLKNAVMTIFSDDPNDPEFIVYLKGTGISSGAPEIQVTFSGTDVISGSTKVSFGTTPLGTSKNITFVMSNIGSADLTISSVSIIGENPDKFTTNFPAAPVTIAPDGETTFQVTFSPGFDRGMKLAEIRFTNNDADESPFILLVRGRGF